MVLQKRFWHQCLALILLIQCNNSDFRFEEQTKIMMDTVVTIAVYDQDKSTNRIRSAIDATFDSIRAIENMTSNYIDSSEISYINSVAGQRQINISASTKKIILESIRIGNLSEGAFNISTWPVLKLWHFNSDSQVIPDKEEICEMLKFVDYQKIQINDDKLSFLEQGMGIDLGGIAKGYAIDRAVKILQDMGVQEMMVNAGGDLRVVSGPTTKGKRRIWIQHPRNKSKLWGYFKLDTGSVATSGDYERFFVYDNVRYHHILDPSTGYPANCCISVTVQAETAMLADALSTAVFVMGPQKGLELVETLKDVEVVILFENDCKIKYHVSSGLKNKLIVIDDKLG